MTAPATPDPMAALHEIGKISFSDHGIPQLQRITEIVASTLYPGGPADRVSLAIEEASPAVEAEREACLACAEDNDKDEREQNAFEAWAKANRYDMHQHPLHWLFLNDKTNAARAGWKAALEYVQDAIRARSQGEQK